MTNNRQSIFVILKGRLFLTGWAALLLTARLPAQSYSLAPSIASGSLGSEWTAFQANPNGYTSSYSITAGSYLTLNNREWLSLSSAPSPGNLPLTVAGTFDIGSAGDFLTVALHTDADTTLGVGRGSQYGVGLDSLQILFSTFGGNSGVSIAAVQGTESAYTLANVAYTFNPGQNYNFSITDNGSLVDVSVGGTLITSFNYTSSSYYTPSGSNVLIYNRESESGFELSNLTIMAVPEPPTFVLFAAGLTILSVFLGCRAVSRSHGRVRLKF
jgi:hypothetical protein